MFRSFAMPVLFALTVNAVCMGLTLETKLRVIFSTLVVMTFISGGYALYQYQTISDPEQFWYWPLLSEKGFTLETYNSMRDGNPRMSGFFYRYSGVFSIYFEYRTVYAVPACADDQEKILRFKVFFIYGGRNFSTVLIIYGSVRTSAIGMISAVLFLAVLQLFRRKLFISLLGYGYFLSVTGSIFLYLALGYTEDLSALDRVRQWYVVLGSLNTMPLGLGFGAIGPGQLHWFDSLWLNLLASSGYLGVAIMMGLICFYSKVVAITQAMRVGGDVFMRGVADYLVISYPFSEQLFSSLTLTVLCCIFLR